MAKNGKGKGGVAKPRPERRKRGFEAGGRRTDEILAGPQAPAAGGKNPAPAFPPGATPALANGAGLPLYDAHMRFRFTLFLLVANLAVFGLIWNNARERNREQPPAELVFPVDADTITLTAADAPESSYTLHRKAGRWSLEKPYEWPASPWLVDKIVSELRFITREGGFTLESVKQYGNTLAYYGLDKPGYTLAVGGVSVKVGGLTKNREGVYLLSPDGATVLLAPKSLLAALIRKPEELRQPEVFSIQPFEVRGITLSLRDEAKETLVGLVRDKREVPGAEAEFIWRFETPVKSDANTPKVDSQLASLGELKYAKFFPGDAALQAEAGLNTPANEAGPHLVRLQIFGNNRQQTLLVGNRDPKETARPMRYAKFEDNTAIFTIDEASLTPWIVSRRVMREPNFFRFNPGELTGITINEGARSLVLHRLDTPAAGANPTQGDWLMPVLAGSTSTTALPVDADQLEQLRNALANLAARDFGRTAAAATLAPELFDAFVSDDPTPEQLKAWGFDAPKRRVELAFRDGTKRTLLIAAPLAPNTPHHAKIEGEPAVYSIAPAVLASLSVNPDAYRRRTLFTLPAGARITGIRLTDLATGTVLLDEKKPDDVVSWDEWMASRPVRDRADVLLLEKNLRTVSANNFIADAVFSENYRYASGDGSEPEGWRYRLEWTVKLPAGAENARTETHTLFFTRRLGGSEQIGGDPAGKLVFSLTQPWVDTLFPLSFGRDSSKDLPPIRTPEAVPATDK